MFIAKFTANTYILVVTAPGEATYNCAVINTKIAVQHFERMEGLGKGPIAGSVDPLSESRPEHDASANEEGTGGKKGRGRASGVTGAAPATSTADSTSHVTDAVQALSVKEGQ